MAPTVCMTDIPMTAADAPSTMQKCWQEGRINKLSRRSIIHLSMRKNECWDGLDRESFLRGARIPHQQNERTQIIIKRRKDLIDIVVRTLALVRRNKILQKKVDALRQETRHFVESVIDNREIDMKKNNSTMPNVVSSTTDEIFIDNTRQNENEIDIDDAVTSTCILSDDTDLLSV